MDFPKLHPASDNNVPRFNDFVSFIRVEDGSLTPSFINQLYALHQETGDVWRPGACGTASYLTRTALRLDLKPNAYRSGFNHYWITLKIGSKELVVDPFGIPDYSDNWEIEPRLILPFFGDIDLAPTDRHKRIYSNSSRGHRKFVA